MVNQGYKQTEVGMIPEDWDLKHLNDFGDVISGGTPSTSVGAYWDGDIAWCTPSDITSTMGKYIYKTDRNITHQGLKNSAATILPPNSILLCTRATIGELKLSGVPMATNQGFKNLCPNATGNVDYLYYLLQTKKKDMVELAIGSTFLEISKKALCSIAMQTPSLPEQECIAEALSDVDSMISSLEKLIAKKKALKQGAMQELLTGKKRLSGFTSEWKKIKFKETNIEVLKGQTITQKEISTGNIPVIAGGKTPAYYCDKFNRTGKNITISASGASAGFVNKYSGNIFASDCSTISESYKYNIDFIYYLLLNMQTAIYASQTGGAQPHIHPNDIYELDVYYAFDLSEQNIIASILSDMDNEIEALEQKLAKTRQVKQGMMQQLLTGKIRLV